MSYPRVGGDFVVEKVAKDPLLKEHKKHGHFQKKFFDGSQLQQSSSDCYKNDDGVVQQKWRWLFFRFPDLSFLASLATETVIVVNLVERDKLCFFSVWANKKKKKMLSMYPQYNRWEQRKIKNRSKLWKEYFHIDPVGRQQYKFLPLNKNEGKQISNTKLWGI